MKQAHRRRRLLGNRRQSAGFDRFRREIFGVAGPRIRTAAAFRTALALPEAKRRALGTRGRAWMVRDFSWQSMAQMSLQAYDWVLGSGDKPDHVRTE